MKATPQPLASEQVILSPATSITGATRRIWRKTACRSRLLRYPARLLALVLLLLVWAVLAVWNLLAWGVFFIPTVLWRSHRRSVKREQVEALRHRERMNGQNAA